MSSSESFRQISLTLTPDHLIATTPLGEVATPRPIAIPTPAARIRSTPGILTLTTDHPVGEEPLPRTRAIHTLAVRTRNPPDLLALTTSHLLGEVAFPRTGGIHILGGIPGTTRGITSLTLQAVTMTMSPGPDEKPQTTIARDRGQDPQVLHGRLREGTAPDPPHHDDPPALDTAITTTMKLATADSVSETR
jgi:hypothetical protein